MKAKFGGPEWEELNVTVTLSSQERLNRLVLSQNVKAKADRMKILQMQKSFDSKGRKCRRGSNTRIKLYNSHK